jgi:hypothetical protein
MRDTEAPPHAHRHRDPAMPNLAKRTSSSMTAAYTWRWPRWRHMVVGQVLLRGQGEAGFVSRMPGRGAQGSPRPCDEARSRLEARGAIETAHRAHRNCVFRYAIATGRAERDPAAVRGALPPVKEKPRGPDGPEGHRRAAARDRWLPGFLRDGSLCGPAYRRLSFGPVGCTLGRTDKR